MFDPVVVDALVVEYEPLPLTFTVAVYAGLPLQLASDGGNSLNRIVPVGLDPFDNDAESVSATPMLPPADGVVEMLGDAGLTVTGSAAQPELAESFLVSPL
jgi:hypothetical protein